MKKKRYRAVICAALALVALGAALLSGGLSLGQKAGDETVGTKVDAGSDPEPEKRMCRSSAENYQPVADEDILGCAGIYEYWSDFKEDFDLPYADDEVLSVLREAYGEIGFRGTFERGNPECYEEYKAYFSKLLDNEMPFTDREKGETVYLKDFEDLHLPGDIPYDKYRYEYCFFDMDGDSAPELVIRNPNHCSIQYIFRFDREKEEFLLWHETGNWCSLFGSGKVAWIWDGGKYIELVSLDADGDFKLEMTGINEWYSDEVSLHAVMLPDKMPSDEMEAANRMKKRGIFVRSEGSWFFRVTQEQYEELTKAFWVAYDMAEIEIEEVTYSYEELFEESGTAGEIGTTGEGQEGDQ